MESNLSEMLPGDTNFFLLANQQTDQRPLTKTLWPVVTISVLYILFSTKLGPMFMKNRKAYQLRPVLIAYNLYQMLINAYLLSRPFVTAGAISYVWNHVCHPIDPAQNQLWIPFRAFQWLFIMSRMVDLLDTVFFVLTKKNSHITFLHVFHHFDAVLVPFYIMKNEIDEQTIVFFIMNCFVHVIMYGYFFLAALGPQFRRYLWWKSHVTKLQLVQFGIMTAHALGLIIADCTVKRNVSVILFRHGCIYLALFGNFCWHAYIVPSRKMPTPNQQEKSQ